MSYFGENINIYALTKKQHAKCSKNNNFDKKNLCFYSFYQLYYR